MEQKEHNPENKSLGFTITLFTGSGEMSTLWLPAKPDGFYSFSEITDCKFLSIEGRNNQWYAFCKRPGFFRNTPPGCYSEVLLADHQYIEAECEDKYYSLLVEISSHEKLTFLNYTVHSEIDITIGNQPSNDITCSNKLISPKHAILSRKDGKWYIKSCANRSDIYVNKCAVNSALLTLGDSIFIMGLRILIGTNFISVNSLREDIHVSDRILRNTARRHTGYGRYSGQESIIQPEEFFNRAPRRHISTEKEIITIEAPPISMERAQMPLMLRMGSAMVMSGKAALSGNYTSLLSSVLFPILSSKYSEKQKQDYEFRRVTKYTEYLEMKRRDIVRVCHEEEQKQNHQFPDIQAILSETKHKERIWERRPNDDDFLTLRLGHGEKKLDGFLDFPVKHFELEPDPLEEKMYDLVEQPYTLHNVPITLSLIEDYVCGILGKREQVIAFIKQLVFQIALHHSYDEVKMVFLMDTSDMSHLDFVRYLPHVWDDYRSIRYLATNEIEAFQLGEHIQKQLPDQLDHENDLSQILKHRPYYVVFALSKKPFYSIEVLKTILSAEQNHGFSIIAALDDLPKECRKIINLSPSGNNTATSLRESTENNIAFLPDYCDSEKARNSMKLLANLSIKSISQEQELPKMVTFLEMFHVGKVEHLNSLQRWQENNPVTSMATPVGVSADGSLFMLDLHEKRQGPHGLVAGMTGSGKSELIITYILSMAVNYHPDEVAFVLIDYKGGGLAGAFDNPKTGLRLPHLVGTITNLDGSAIHRSLASIESELMRRQRIFNEIKSSTNEGTMDIYSYQKLYRARKVEKPMPHLFIVSDEFAELKQQQPEFMEKLISAARIGRSLGIHLILATQKPSGVVNDQIRSNTKFRVCLRVQDRADSMDMLKRPEAAELTDTGRFYLQIGYNEYFALGQSAWCGASYEPQDVVKVQRDDSVEFLATNGKIITKSKPKVKREKTGVKQIVAIVQYLSDLAKQENYTIKSLWKEPLPSSLLLDEVLPQVSLKNVRTIQTPLGIADDPDNQTQHIKVQNLQSCHNLLIVGEGGSGKSTMLQSIMHSLADRYGPDRVNFYILDFSNKLLSPYKNLPHCGAYLTSEDEDSLERFFAFILEEANRRKKLFESAGIYSYDKYIQNHILPLMIIVVDNIIGLSGSKVGTNIAYKLHEYLRVGASYGIQFIISANFINEVNAKSRQELGDRIALRAKDRFAYSDILGKKTRHTPGENPGRGMCLIDDRPLEFQAVSIYANNISVESGNQLSQWITTIQNRYTAIPNAPCLPMLNPDETYEHFCEGFPSGRIPLGYLVKDVRPIALPLKQLNCLSLYFGNPVGVAPVLRNILHACQREHMDILVIKKNTASLFNQKIYCGSNVSLISCTEEGSLMLLKRMIQETQYRIPHRNTYLQENGIDRTDSNATTLASDYVRNNTKGLVLIFESFLEFCESAHVDCKNTFFKFFQQGKGLNYYFIGCFYPDDSKKISANPIMKGFNQEQVTLLFGGQFHRQDLISLPYEYKNVTSESKQYNNYLMHYRNKIQPMQMPCGALESGDSDDDLAPIF